ncbi:MAG TPA: phosphotransferase [Steroidobacteraceae bacterium]|nr:phosphotransferase [Steroidobacteraceae bacterium]HRX89229.1 phosphotransferase [Steroidobacteraceae bacterium]
MTEEVVLATVRPGLEIDAGRLGDWLAANVPGYRGPLAVRQFSGGQSNPTYLLETASANYVLRRKPPGELLASAHAVEREYRVLRALTDVPVPAPRAVALCEDPQVIGTVFYVMEHVAGRIFWDSSFPELPRNDRGQYVDATNAAIASLHCVDYQAVGLADFGRAEGYVARQVARWSKQYLSDPQAGRVDALDRLVEWLPQHVPATASIAVVHGDFRCDNLVFHPSEPRVLAILDWELATIGDPIADFAYLLMIYRLPSLAFPGLAGIDLQAQGIPSERQFVDAYCRRTGRDSLPNLDVYLAYCMFRLAAIFHGIRGRVLRGTAVSPRAREYAQHVEALAGFAWQQAERVR